jgi:hypothetical protein
MRGSRPLASVLKPFVFLANSETSSRLLSLSLSLLPPSSLPPSSPSLPPSLPPPPFPGSFLTVSPSLPPLHSSPPSPKSQEILTKAKKRHEADVNKLKELRLQAEAWCRMASTRAPHTDAKHLQYVQ